MRTKITQFVILVSLFTFLVGCGGSKSSSKSAKHVLLNQNTFKVEVYSDDPTYGYTENNPIKVGGAMQAEGPLNERRFLNALMGPNGEAITYSRIGSCCHFKTKNGIGGKTGLLDKYRVAYKGLEKETVLYINMYDAEELKIPIGFKNKE